MPQEKSVWHANGVGLAGLKWVTHLSLPHLKLGPLMPDMNSAMEVSRPARTAPRLRRSALMLTDKMLTS